MLYAWSLLFAFLVLSPAFAQETAPQKPLRNLLGASDFLGPYGHFQVHGIETDSNGYVYFSGPNGILKYDGSEAIRIEVDSVFVHLPLGKLYKDAQERFWTSAGLGIGYVENDLLVEFPLPDSLKKHLTEGVECCYMDRGGTLHLSLRSKGYYQIGSDGAVKQISSHIGDKHGFIVTHLEDGTPFWYYTRQADPMDSTIGLFYEDQQHALRFLGRTKDAQPGQDAALVTHPDGSMTFSNGSQTILHFTKDQLLWQKQLEFTVTNLFLDAEEQLWIGTLHEGFKRALDDQLTQFESYLDGSAAVMAQDLEGGLWIISNQIFFGYLPKPSIKYISDRTGFEPFKKIQRVVGVDGEIYCLVFGEGMYLLANDSIRKIPLPDMGFSEAIRDLSYFKTAYYDPASQKLWLGFPGRLARWDDGKWTIMYLNEMREKNRDILIKVMAAPDGQIIGLTQSKIYAVSGDSVILLASSEDRIYDLAIEPSGKMWLSTKEGVRVVENKQMVPPFDPMPSKLPRFNKQLVAAHGSVWVQPSVGTSPLLRITGDKIEKVFDQDGVSVQAGLMAVDPSGDIWLLSDNQRGVLFRIGVQEGQTVVDRFQYDVQAAYELSGNLLVTEKQVYSGNVFGLFYADRDQLLPESRNANPVIHRIHINHELVRNRTHYELDYDQNLLNIEFDGISFLRGQMEFRYRLIGMDSTWYPTDYQQAQYSNLDPGTYRFQVHSRVVDMPWSQPTEVVFVIAKPFWQTTWFLCFATLVGFLSLYAGYRFATHRAEQKEKEKSKLALEMSRLELRAIKAQLNPHFIFNAMTSVMYYLSSNQAENAEIYLQRFSKLIRSVLENSEKAVIPLSEEMNLMRNYVTLESERFPGTGIQLETSFESINPDELLLPPSLFQPYIENAIWHGLQHKEGLRKITVRGYPSDDFFRLMIEDNGIGRKAAAEKEGGRKKERSFGMMIASRRIEAFNNKEVEGVTTEDLFDEDGRALGTRISFYIPLISKPKMQART